MSSFSSDVEQQPNGDPADNMPRMTLKQAWPGNDVAESKIRNYVELTRAEQDGFEIYVQEGASQRSAQKDPSIRASSHKGNL